MNGSVTMRPRSSMKLIDLIVTAAETALRDQRGDGSLPAGRNGPHGDPETAVRNTAHWLVTFTRLYRIAGDVRWRSAARRAANFLMSQGVRPHGFTFHHRDRDGKDRCNGPIGAAWTFEGLTAAGDVLEDTACIELAEDVFFQFPFDEARGLWRIREIDGRDLGYDGTFNHQLWFAAAASELDGPRRDQVVSRVARFLDCSAENLQVLPNGLIHHAIPPLRLADSAGSRMKIRAKEAAKSLLIPGIRGRVRALRAELLRRSIGYQAFNLHAFGILKDRFPAHPIWDAEWLRKAVAYTETEEFVQALEDNPYGYPYNPPGFEVPFALSRLRGLSRDAVVALTAVWVDRQLRRTLDPESGALARNNPDPVTLTARYYEATRLPDEVLMEVDVSHLTGTLASGS